MKDTEQLLDLLDNVNDLIQSVAPDGSLLYVNRAWRETLGYSESEIERLNIFDVIHPDSRAHCMEAFQKVTQGEKLDWVEAIFVAKDGTCIIVEGGANCQMEDGQAIATRAIFHDVTHRRQVEDDLRESQARFEAFMNNLPMVAYLRGEDHRLIYANRPFLCQFDKSLEELVGTTEYDLFPPEVAVRL